jgi:hypothetical protein
MNKVGATLFVKKAETELKRIKSCFVNHFYFPTIFNGASATGSRVNERAVASIYPPDSLKPIIYGAYFRTTGRLRVD